MPDDDAAHLRHARGARLDDAHAGEPCSDDPAMRRVVVGFSVDVDLRGFVLGGTRRRRAGGALT
jgi:hypothetical protein